MVLQESNVHCYNSGSKRNNKKSQIWYHMHRRSCLHAVSTSVFSLIPGPNLLMNELLLLLLFVQGLWPGI